ncbi:MAG: hypothetical protein EOP55_01195 [Sphingobacteriales bacterium]|nr:MAG: hypothetical protein EOP55_01195 [Sphingobacteriales bacterium]
MNRTATRKIQLDDLIIGGLQVAGNAIGLHKSKQQIGKNVAKNIGIVNKVMELAFTKEGNSPYKLQKNVELAGLGVIAAYNFYKGIKRKRKTNVLQGAFLALTLGVVIYGSIKKGVNKLTASPAVQHKDFSKDGFADLLKKVYPEIVETNWKSEETLEVLINDGNDLEVFSTFFKDEVSNIVKFEDHVDVMIRTKSGNYFVIATVN